MEKDAQTMTPLCTEQKLRQARWALRLISIGTSKCENFWKDYTCVTAGRKRTTKYGADRWCNTCIANDALRKTR
jgi:hypothetical protein